MRQFSMNRFSRVVLRDYYLMHPMLRLKVYHDERVPSTGAGIILGKHQCYGDITALTASTVREIRYMAKRELFRHPIAAWYLYQTGAFPVTQNSPDREAVRTAISKLQAGEIVGIFGEGTRIRGDVVGPIQGGVITIVRRSETDCPIIPCGICYRRNRGGVLRIVLCYGEPFRLGECGMSDSERLEGIRARLQGAQNEAVQLQK